MAKPLRYGPTIGVRLPVEIHSQILELAGPDGPGPYIRDLVVDQLDTPTPHNDPSVCDHHTAVCKVISGGMKQLTCANCGAVKTSNGPWTQP